MRIFAYAFIWALGATAAMAQGIVAVVNNQPITGYQLQHRRDLLVLETDVLDRARQHYAAWTRSPDFKQRLKQIHQAVKLGAGNKSSKVQKPIFKGRVDLLGKEMVAKSIEIGTTTARRLAA